jgi:formylglycine-generating enzyme required for sulfatase activity
VGHDGGVVEVGHDGQRFSFDNEGPRHQVLLRPFEVATSLANEDWLAFVNDGGYTRPELWMSDWWNTCRPTDGPARSTGTTSRVCRRCSGSTASASSSSTTPSST